MDAAFSFFGRPARPRRIRCRRLFGRRRCFDRPIGCGRVLPGRAALQWWGRGQIDARPGLIRGPQGQGHSAHRDYLIGIQLDGAFHGTPTDVDRNALVQDRHPNVSARVQADVPTRQTRIFQNEVAVVVSAERGFFVGQSDLGADMHAGQNLHGPEMFSHSTLPARP